MVSPAQIRDFALSLPRTTEGLVRDSVRFRIGKIVYLAFSPDETLMGFAFPKEERDALVASEPATFQLPRTSDLRFNWVVARLDRLDEQRTRELVLDAWRMCVPKKVSALIDESAVGGSSYGVRRPTKG
ncbi:MAG: hypothetical protein QOD07_1561 [Frankiaceae bacterium]|jgi:hypothetical protein|nr:hypothetical protein [Frankiaceae bacterium]